MTPFQAVVLSLVQAVTEFLPISSSGHLILVPYLLGWPDQGLSFDVAAHVGTMLAVVAYFRADVVELVSGFFSGAPGRRDFEPRRLGWALVVGTIPAALAGLALAATIETHLRQPLLIACTTFPFALTRPAAARFAFLLFIPVGVLAGGHDLLKLWRAGELWHQLTPILIAVVVSGVAGYLVIGWLLGWLRSRPLTVFVVYRVLLALAIVGVLLARR